MRVTQDNIESVLRALQHTPVLSLDTETTGVEETDKPFALIIADAQAEYYFDERLFPGVWDNGGLGLLLSDPDKVWLMQNAKFDMRMIQVATRRRITGTVADIAIAARLRKNDHFAYSLDAQAQREGWKKDDKVKEYIKKNKLYETRKDYFGEEYQVPRYDWVPVEIMEAYACMDARLTYDLYHTHIDKFDEHDWRVFKNERELTHVCYQMERVGVRLNHTYTLQAMYAEREKLMLHKTTYREVTGTEFVNSAKSVGKHLSMILPTTEDGNPSLTDDVIENLMTKDYVTEKDKQILAAVQQIRYYDKRINTYYVSYLNRMDKHQVVHPTMWQAGTRTGRFSYSDPNLQNIPKEEESTEEFVVRGCFVPRPGNIFVSLDYSQMEYFLMVAYANEVEIIKAVMGGADFHQATADLFGVSRKQAKTLNFAILYGAGVEKLAGMLGVTEREARRLKDRYFTALPRVETLVDRIISTGKARGYVHNWFGRRLKADYSHCYALPNHLIQGGGADVVKIAMVRIAKELPEVLMVLQIHDQLVFDMPPEQLRLIPRIKEIMESVFPDMNGVKLRTDVSWSNTSLAERDMIKGIPSVEEIYKARK